MQLALERGWRSCVLHFRDCGDYTNRLPRRYHAGETNDLRFFLDQIQEERQTSQNPGPLLAVGYSLGGNVLLKYLGESGSDTPLAAAAGVCVPLDLHECSVALNIGFSRIYQRYLLKPCKGAVTSSSNSANVLEFMALSQSNAAVCLSNFRVTAFFMRFIKYRW